MNESTFQSVRAALDAELDAVGNADVGIKMGWVLYTEFRDRDLLAPRVADMVFWKWDLPSYRGKFVADTFDIDDNDFVVGKPMPKGPRGGSAPPT